MPILLPERTFLAQDPRVTLARPVLGLSLYLRDGLAWAAGHAASLLERFLASAPPGHPLVYRSSTLGRWREPTREELTGLPEQLRLGAYGGGRLRDFFLFELADEAWAPSLSFRYREIDDVRTGQWGWIRITRPPLSDPEELLALLIEAAQSYPLEAAIGGYTSTYNADLERTAFSTLYGWHKRWLGLGLHLPDEASFSLRDGLPEVSWLTYVSDRAAERWGLTEPLRERGWSARVQALPLRAGTLIKAGGGPPLGDLNQGEYPSALAEIARALDPLLAPLRHELPGRFGEEDATDAWRARFSRPEGWS